MTEQTAQQLLDFSNFMLDHIVPWIIVYYVFRAVTQRFDQIIVMLREINAGLMLRRR